jgi:hypothetical protein
MMFGRKLRGIKFRVRHATEKFGIQEDESGQN